MTGLTPADVAPITQEGGRRRRGASVKTLKRALKKAGLKTSGKKAALTRRAKKAHLKVGGADGDDVSKKEAPAPQTPSEEEDVVMSDGGRRRRGSRRSKKFLGMF